MYTHIWHVCNTLISYKIFYFLINITEIGENAKRPLELWGSGHYTPWTFILVNLLELYTRER